MTTDAKSLALGMVVLKHVADRVNPALKTLRANAADALDARDRVTAVAPDGTVVGTITKTDPSPVVTIDLDQLGPWLARNYPDAIERRPYIAPENMDLAIAALRKHEPELIDCDERIADWATAAVLKGSQTARQPVGPGGELDVPGVVVTLPEGTVTTRVDPYAADALADLITSGLVALDGSVRSLPAGGAE